MALKKDLVSCIHRLQNEQSYIFRPLNYVELNSVYERMWQVILTLKKKTVLNADHFLNCVVLPEMSQMQIPLNCLVAPYQNRRQTESGRTTTKSRRAVSVVGMTTAWKDDRHY